MKQCLEFVYSVATHMLKSGNANGDYFESLRHFLAVGSSEIIF